MPKISVKNLGISYYTGKTEFQVFEDLSLCFENTKFNCLMGPSGCGKSTLLKCIAGLITYAGNIYFDDQLIDKYPPNKRNLAYVSQNYSLYPHMTVFDNLAFPLKMIHAPSKEIKERVLSLADELGLTDCLFVRPKFISGGQQQRVAIGRALISRPSIMLFDEPLSNLDAETRNTLLILIKEIVSKRNITCIYVTHELYEAEKVMDKLFVLNNDKVISFDSVEEIDNSNDSAIAVLKGLHD